MFAGGIKKNIPNILTVSRFVFAFMLIIFFLINNYILVFIFFLLGAFSDPLDGYLARKWNLVSNWGKKWDPLADKALTWTSYLLLISSGINYGFVIIFVMLFLREIITNQMKNKLGQKGIIVSATKLAKQKTINQMIMLGWLWLAMLRITAYTNYFFLIAFVFGISAVIFAYYSGYEYAMYYRKYYKYKDLFFKSKKEV